MIRPPGFTGAAFGTAADGDGRADEDARKRISAQLGIPDQWAWPRQVHGGTVLRAGRPGDQGEGDAIWTTAARLPAAVATADCFPVIVEAPGAVGVVHAGWRGVVAGVATRARDALDALGAPVERAAIGPGIGPCCYEVGPDVSGPLGDHLATTTWGTRSVDLAAAVAAQLPGIEVWRAGRCTRCDPAFHSYRRDRTAARQVAVGWLPSA